MAKLTDLDVDSIAAIGLMFLNGDDVEDMLLDKYGHVDYDFDKFNSCKKVLMKLERIAPEKALHAFLWQMRPDNAALAVPLVAASVVPSEGTKAAPLDEHKAKAFAGAYGVVAVKANGQKAWYYPVKNSDAEIVGVLELTSSGEVAA